MSPQTFKIVDFGGIPHENRFFEFVWHSMGKDNFRTIFGWRGYVASTEETEFWAGCDKFNF